MTQAVLFFQADHWKAGAAERLEISWESGRYPNDELWVKLNVPPEVEEIQCLAGFHDREPLDGQIMRLLLVLESARRAARRVKLILPYLPYSLQDRDVRGGDAIAARAVIRAIESTGIDSVTLLDLHNPETTSEWHIDASELHADELLAQQIREVYDPSQIAIVSPDAGAVERARRIAHLLEVPLLELEKVRRGPGDVTVSGTIESCSAQHYIVIDDMINTGGTIVETAQLVREQCQVRVSVAVVHGLFAGNAREKLESAPIDHLFVTNSFNSTVLRSVPPNWRVVDLTPLFHM